MARGRKDKTKQKEASHDKVLDSKLKAGTQINSSSKLLMSQIDHKITEFFQNSPKLYMKCVQVMKNSTEADENCCFVNNNNLDSSAPKPNINLAKLKNVQIDKKSEEINVIVPSCDETSTKTVRAKAKNEPSQQSVIPNIGRHKILAKHSFNGTRKKCPAHQGKTLTYYFPVRRSNRKCKREILDEKQKKLEEAVISGNEDGLEVINFENKGRGVIAAKPFSRGDFVVEYHGDLLDLHTAKEKEKKYALDSKYGCYMYYFTFKNQQYCVDATKETGRLGRLINHSKSGNLVTKQIAIDNVPHLILVASRDIDRGEELLYDYGDRSKTALLWHPWLAS